MISNQELQELAGFTSKNADAISFYFGAQTPTELAHREEPILTKEKIQEVFGNLQGNSPSVREDIHRLLEAAAGMKGNASRAKVVFACGSQQFWREYDLQGNLPLLLDAANTFRLAPLLPLLTPHKRYCIALADRNRARLLILEGGNIREHSDALDEELDPELDKIRTTGTGGSRHVERQREEMVRQHFKFLASHLLHFHEHNDFDALIVGCRDTMWPEIEQVLHSDLKRVLIGHFKIDPGLATAKEVQERAKTLIHERQMSEHLNLLHQTVGAAAADARGAVGLPAVLRAIEKGEVQTLVWTPRQNAEAHPVGACRNCGHLRLGEERTCDLCGQEMHVYARAEEALVRRALQSRLEVRVIEDATLPPPNGFAAVLRFRSDHNTARVLAS
jgi:peptide subunit release factor 1 (eRF1)